MLDYYSAVAEGLTQHGRPATREQAKRLVLADAYRTPLTAVETYVLGVGALRLDALHRHDRVEALFPRRPG